MCEAFRRLVGQAYPDLLLDARERPACNHFMDMLEDTEMRYEWRVRIAIAPVPSD